MADATFFYIRAIAAVVSDQPDTLQADFVSFEDDREAAIGEAMDHFRWLDEQEDQGFPEAALKDCVLEVNGPFPLGARAEAQDEGAAGERLLAFADDVAAMSVAIAVSNYTGALADDIRSVLDRTHPSPTPAADADRVRIAVAAGEASAYRVRMISDDPAEWVLMHPEKALDFLSRKGWESQPLYAHPSPTPAADASCFECASDLWGPVCLNCNPEIKAVVERGPDQHGMAKILHDQLNDKSRRLNPSALKSTAAKEGGE